MIRSNFNIPRKMSLESCLHHSTIQHFKQNVGVEVCLNSITTPTAIERNLLCAPGGNYSRSFKSDQRRGGKEWMLDVYRWVLESRNFGIAHVRFSMMLLRISSWLVFWFDATNNLADSREKSGLVNTISYCRRRSRSRMILSHTPWSSSMRAFDFIIRIDSCPILSHSITSFSDDRHETDCVMFDKTRQGNWGRDNVVASLTTGWESYWARIYIGTHHCQQSRCSLQRPR